MREAPALAGVTGGRPRPNAPRRKAATPKRTAAPSLLGRAFARPGVTIAGAVFAALMAGVVANAILFQKGHHPAPLLAGARHSDAAPAVVPVPTPPLPPIAPAPAIAADPAPAAPPAAAPVTQVPKPAAAARKPTAARAHSDQIAGLIARLSDSPATAIVSKKPAAPKPHPKPAGTSAVADGVRARQN